MSTIRISRSGLIASALLVLLIVALYSLQYLAPTTWIGSAMSTRLGSVVAFGAVIGLAVAVERWLYRRGIRFLEGPRDDTRE